MDLGSFEWVGADGFREGPGRRNEKRAYKEEAPEMADV